MLDDEKITSMKQDDIDKLSSEEWEKFSSFKTLFENYYESAQHVQSAHSNAIHMLKQKNTIFRLPKQYIPLKVYFESIGLLLLSGIVFSYYIITSNELQITQSNTKMYIFLLYILLIILAGCLPFLVLPKKVAH